MFVACGRSGESQCVFVVPGPSLVGPLSFGDGVGLKRMGQSQLICEADKISLLPLFPESNFCDYAYH